MKRSTLVSLAGLLGATLGFVEMAGCGGGPAPVVKKPVLPAPVAKAARPPAESEPVFPDPEEIDEEDEPALDAAAASRLVGDWVWLGTVTPTQTFKVDKPNHYHMSINPRGWFALQAECVKAEGLFEARGERIAFAVVQQTAGTSCAAPRLLEDYLKTLEAAASYRLVGDRLRLRLNREKKEMVFFRARIDAF